MKCPRQLLVSVELAFLTWALAAAVLVSAAVTFTGDARKDFASITSGSLVELVDVVDETRCTSALLDPCLLLPNGRRSGWDIKSVFLAWSYPDDILYVGFDCTGICGDADGDGYPGSPTNLDRASLAGCESVGVFIDVDLDGPFRPVLSFGVPGTFFILSIIIIHRQAIFGLM